jgi:hypothetical protein
MNLVEVQIQNAWNITNNVIVPLNVPPKYENSPPIVGLTDDAVPAQAFTN